MTEKYGDIDWLNMSGVERIAPTQALYRAFADAAECKGMSIDLMLGVALSEQQARGTDYVRNFRAGKISKIKAKKVHLWLAQNHFDKAHETSPDLFPHPVKDAFQGFIDKHAITGKLRIVRIKNALGILQRSDDRRERVETLRLSEKFCFELDTDISGIASAFQRYQGRWHPMPLGEDQRRVTAVVERGTNLLPRTADRKPISLEENDDAGSHQFAVVISEDRKAPTITNELERLPRLDHNYEVHVVDLRFVT